MGVLVLFFFEKKGELNVILYFMDFSNLLRINYYIPHNTNILL